jgi:hypothetical protein
MPTQTDWNNYHAAIALHWALCANCTVPLSGKKLYRQVNLNRSLIGLPVDDIPPAGNPYSILQGGSGYLDTTTSPASVSFDIQGVSATGDYAVATAVLDPSFNRIRLNKALASPLLFAANIAYPHFAPMPDPFGQWLADVNEAAGIGYPPGGITVLILYCTFLPSGAPGLRRSFNCTYFGP